MYGKPVLVVDCSKDKVRTKQSFANECDINQIVARFEKTGMIEHLNEKEPFYGDVSGIGDYQSALNTVREAEDLFMAMSPAVRKRFSNDPAEMLAFLSDEKNRKEAEELGMVTPRPVEKPPEVPPTEGAKP